MKPPSTYSEWVDILDKFGNGDDTLFDELNAGSFKLEAGTAQRYYLRVEEVYKKRKQNWVDKFERSFQMRNVKTIDDFGIVLREGRQNLMPLIKFVTSKGLPDDLKITLNRDLEASFNAIKKSLIDNVSRVSINREKMLVALNTFVICKSQTEPSVNSKQIDQNETCILPLVVRKIIF